MATSAPRRAVWSPCSPTRISQAPPPAGPAVAMWPPRLTKTPTSRVSATTEAQRSAAQGRAMTSGSSSTPRGTNTVCAHWSRSMRRQSAAWSTTWSAGARVGSTAPSESCAARRAAASTAVRVALILVRRPVGRVATSESRRTRLAASSTRPSSALISRRAEGSACGSAVTTRTVVDQSAHSYAGPRSAALWSTWLSPRTGWAAIVGLLGWLGRRGRRPDPPEPGPQCFGTAVRPLGRPPETRRPRHRDAPRSESADLRRGARPPRRPGRRPRRRVACRPAPGPPHETVRRWPTGPRPRGSPAAGPASGPRLPAAPPRRPRR